MLAVAAALVIVGIWGSVTLARSAQKAERHVQLFASERMVTAGEVVRLRRRGGDDDYRTTAHYRYVARGRELTGATRLRPSERDSYVVGSHVAVWYLPSEPEASWLDGYAPRPQPDWPATALPIVCGVSALGIVHAVRRQSKLLANGRPAHARVTKVQKKLTDNGTFWVVHYEFTTLSGAKRIGKYNHGRKNIPATGSLLSVLYDRDNSSRHTKYPLSFVSLKEN